MANKAGNPIFKDPAWQAAHNAKPRKRKADTPPPATPLVVPLTPREIADELIKEAFPEIVEALLDNVRKRKDKTSAMYLIDRLLGPTSKADTGTDNFLSALERIGRALSEDSGRQADLESPPDPVGDGGLSPRGGTD
jgi:hypothetical protein